jgi:hypothetical protein
MARKPPDLKVLHGHRVISGSELRATFVEQDDGEDNPVRLRRRILHGVVPVLLVGMLVAAIVVALAIMNGQIKLPAAAERSKAAVSACPAATYDYTPPKKITLNAYNSTGQPGLARTVADAFAARKFAVSAVGNKASSYRGAVLIVSGAAGQSAAFSVQRNVPGSNYVQDGRTDASVDVILTDDFKGLAKPELVDQTPGRLTCPRESKPTPKPTAPHTGG